jgi:hypothetical protein
MTDVREEIQEEEELTTADVAGVEDRRETAPDARRDGPRSDEIHPPVRPEESQPTEPGWASLFLEEEAQKLRSGWSQIQTGFVDNPRQAVEEADHLVAQTIKRLAEVFAEERNRLEQQWSRGDNVSTEDLRLALQRYRSFFDRLLSV